MVALTAKLLFLVSALAASQTVQSTNLIRKDVIVVGGGASGAYAALRLKEDLGKSVVLIEKEGRLGGHVSPYRDPVTGDAFDIGVQVYLDNENVKALFSRLNISTQPYFSPNNPTTWADFTTGKPVNFTPAAFVPDVLGALQTYHDAIAPYENLYLPGFFNFPAPKDIPADLLLPFRDFVKKYKFEPALTIMFQSTGLGLGDLLGSTTLYVLAAFGGPFTRAFLGTNAMYTPASGRNIEVYEKIAAKLGTDVLYNSVVSQSSRSDKGVSVTVKGPNGKLTKIEAKKLLIAIAPTMENLKPFDLDNTEKDVLGKLGYTNEYIFLVSHPSLPLDASIANIPAAAAPSNLFALPTSNLLSGIDFHGNASKPLWRINTVGTEKFTLADAKALVSTQFKKLMSQGIIPKSNVPLQFVDVAVHGPMHMHASVAELKKGFIQRFYALEGRRSTWFTGGAWSSGYQSILWDFDEIILKKMYQA